MAHSKRMQEAEINALAPVCVTWSREKVADWIQEIGYGMYKVCFYDNFIDGRKLILLQADKLPKLGIQDFEHIQAICKAVRGLLEQPDPDYGRCVSLPHTERLGLFLEQKSPTGKKADSLTYSHYLKVNDSMLNRVFWK